MITFNEILTAIKKYMILEGQDEHIIDLLLATALSLELNRPIWLMIIAPPSSGKTELLNTLTKLENYHPLHNLTPKFLFSGHPLAQGGYMNRKVKERGLLAFPDFTTVLSLDSKPRNIIFNQLRVIYDGKAGLGTGIDSGNYNTWEGKIALIALVTEAIEKLKEKSSDLGERFLYYNYFSKELDEESFVNRQMNDPLKKFVPDSVLEFISSRTKLITQKSVSEEEIKWIFRLAKFIAYGRATVERDGYKREISNIHQPEKPFRIFTALEGLYKSLITINEDINRTTEILRHVAKSSIPRIRIGILLRVHRYFGLNITFKDIFKNTKISESKIRRTVDDLNALRILDKIPAKDRNQFYLRFNVNFLNYWKAIIGEE